jgi:exodeoxyribonuclease-3
MKIISWNVNGLKALLKKENLTDLINKEDPDIICMCETKLGLKNRKNIDNEINETNQIYTKYKYKYWHNSEIKQGYSGTAILIKKEPDKVIYGLQYKNKEYDVEGRVITIELDTFYLINVYTPNSGEALHRLDWRIKIWDKMFRKYIIKLQQIKPVIICGDLNVAHEEIDLKNPKSNLKTAGFTIQERESFNKLLNKVNLKDIYRELYPNKIEYSYWSYMKKAREKNIGWRIDYFLLSIELIKNIKDICILTNIYGSDHAPIKIII